jgi:endonuclease YncB( thermonuclease family)
MKGIQLHPLALVAFSALVTMISGAALAEIIGRASVIDGDTIEIHGQRIRLHGIDAPEKGQPCFDASGKLYRCGQVAAMALDHFIGASPVNCRERDVDRYGRTVADCSVRGEDIELWLVRNGHAMAYRKYSSAYIGAEQEAKNAKRGIWAGQTQPPWEWRKEQRGGL